MDTLVWLNDYLKVRLIHFKRTVLNTKLCCEPISIFQNWNVGIHPQDYMALQALRPQLNAHCHENLRFYIRLFVLFCTEFVLQSSQEYVLFSTHIFNVLLWLHTWTFCSSIYSLVISISTCKSPEHLEVVTIGGNIFWPGLQFSHPCGLAHFCGCCYISLIWDQLHYRKSLILMLECVPLFGLALLLLVFVSSLAFSLQFWGWHATQHSFCCRFF